MFKPFIINPPVFFGALIIIFLFLAVGALFPANAEEIFRTLQVGILNQFGWFYLLSVGIFLVAVLLMCLGRFGRLKLGPDDATPDFSFSPGSPCCLQRAWALALCSMPSASR